MSSQLMSTMDFDHKANHFEASYNDSSFAYMENDFLYTSSSPAELGVSIGLPQTMSPMDISSVNMPEYTFSSPSFPAPPSPPTEIGNISPPMLTYNLSGAELSSDALPSGRISRGSGSHSPPHYAATVPRSQRFNPIAVPANRPATRAAHKRKASRSTTQDESDDDDDEEFKPAGSIVASNDPASRDSRRETVRKQRIESEQRRRDELREGYSRLKETLPASNQKASKVSILDRAVSHIKYLEAVKEQLEVRLKGADHEVHRLRNVNEALMLNRAGAATLGSSFAN
ncbi:hypothetical protein CPB83DRAFT_760304 [Crepidotus variabilis]|uniref:BHLH domain-containing protein n=1 Tax=Crepidotus variabilis TaxID=179855 RepID=A0A9P6JTF5_9AGAR|nr:hypothetical protein CPB83DRAFT_760304 [Crepidotus variabilis]